MAETSPTGKSGLLRRLWGGGPEKTKTARLAVNAYGKLPIYKDFISSGMTDAPAREFRGWLDKGFSHRWSTDEGCQNVEVPPHSFLLRMPDCKGYVAGSLWGSSDEGGLRKFPFALFFSFPKDHPASDPVAAVEYLGELERRASELRFLFGPGASLSSFYQSYRGAELDVVVQARDAVLKDFRSELSAFSVGELAESLFADDAPRTWPALLAAAGAGGDDPGAVRLPLGGSLPRAREVEFWLFWLERQDPKGRRPVTGVIYPHGHNPGRATFLFREVRPEDFLLLHPTRSDVTQVHEPLGRRAVEAAEERPVPVTPDIPDVPSAAPAPAAAESAPAPTRAPPIRETPVPHESSESAAVAVVAAVDVVAAVSDGESTASAIAAAAVAPAGEAETAGPTPAPVAESPFPEAEIPPEPTAGGRLSQILTLDAGSVDGTVAVDAAQAAPVEPVPEGETKPPSEPPAEPPAEPRVPEVPEAAEPPAAADGSPAAPAPSAAPAPAATPLSDIAAPTAPSAAQRPAPAPASLAPPPGWERPLATLLDP